MSRKYYSSPRHDSNGDIIGWTQDRQPAARRSAHPNARVRDSGAGALDVTPSPASPTRSPPAVSPPSRVDTAVGDDTPVMSRSPSGARTPASERPQYRLSRAPEPAATPSFDDRPIRPAGSSPSAYVLSSSGSPMGLNMDAFLPRGSNPFGVQPVRAAPDDQNTMSDLMQPVRVMMQIMNSRLTKIRVVKAHYQRGDSLGAVQYAISVGDPALLVDVLNVFAKRDSFFTLEISAAVIAAVVGLLQGEYEDYLVAAARTLAVIARQHVGTMQTLIQASIEGRLAEGKEMQLEYARSLREQLLAARSLLAGMQDRPRLAPFVSVLLRYIDVL